MTTDYPEELRALRDALFSKPAKPAKPDVEDPTAGNVVPAEGTTTGDPNRTADSDLKEFIEQLFYPSQID